MTQRTRLLRFARGAALTASCALLTGCGFASKMATRTVADRLSKSGDVFTRDDDPELVRMAVPFALKTYESLLETLPEHGRLLLAACSGFTSYSFAFVQTDADILGDANHHDEVKALNGEALGLYVRAKDYCLRALEVRLPGVTRNLILDDPAALAHTRKTDVELLYWTAASWGSAMSLNLDLAIDFPAVRALVARALALDETWRNGSLHELMITLESVTQLGGSVARAREHFRRAVELQGGVSPGPYVGLALGVSQPRQDRAEFETLLNDALAIDPNRDTRNRLNAIITQRRARALRDQIDVLFAK